MEDFQFLSNMRVIRHRRLAERMAKSDEWIAFETDYEAWSLLDGAASIDRVFGNVGGEPSRDYDRRGPFERH